MCGIFLGKISLKKELWKKNFKIILVGKEILRTGTAELCTTSLLQLSFLAAFRLK